MKMKTYTVKVRYIFNGEYYITADSKKQAKDYARKHCGLVLGGDIHTTLPDEIVDWKFDVYPEEIVK